MGSGHGLGGIQVEPVESEPRDVERLGLWDAFLGDGKTLSREQGLHWSCLKLQVSIKDIFPSVSK